MNGFADIPELAQLHSGHSLIRVPMEQNVPFTGRVRSLVDTEEFQRLSEISQLGLVAKVYPGARHTRFEHVLGVYHNALRYLQQLSNDPRFAEVVTPHQAEVLIVAALLHDLGHWPFCHPIEDLGLTDMPPHEAHAARFLGEGTEIADILRRDWSIEPAEVLDILVPQSDSQALDLLRSILSGPIDVDKMDYLDRDSLHCGVPYGRNFDRQRLIQSLVVNDAGDGLAITDKGKTAAELMVFARYVMFSEVYWHHAVRSATSMFARAFYDLHQEFDWTELFCMTDAEMISALRQAAEGTPSQKLLDGVFGRRRGLYKRAAEYSHEHAPEIYNLIAGRPYNEIAALSRALVDEVNARTQRQLQVTDLLIDAPPPHREVEFAIDIYFPKQQRFRPLRQVSPVVDALARTQFDEWVKQVRIFIAPDQRDMATKLNWDDVVQTACARVD
ncbi:MAG: HD domain-containing protein [Planctomycetaceae bacterium]|nr:HD domain-containing protein [Planctomycetaceae bacterium]